MRPPGRGAPAATRDGQEASPARPARSARRCRAGSAAAMPGRWPMLPSGAARWRSRRLSVGSSARPQAERRPSPRPGGRRIQTRQSRPHAPKAVVEWPAAGPCPGVANLRSAAAAKRSVTACPPPARFAGRSRPSHPSGRHARCAAALIWPAKSRQLAVLNISTGPPPSWRVSRTAIRSCPAPTSTQSPPLAPLWLLLRQRRSSRSSICVPPLISAPVTAAAGTPRPAGHRT